MSIRTIRDIQPAGKRVLLRVDFNVPLKGREITDDTRIRQALPTIKELLTRGASLVIMSHLGRPGGEKKPEFSLAPIKDRLGKLTGAPVVLAPDILGPEVEKLAENLKSGEILLLENTRFYKEETDNDKDFARKLAGLGDLYVNDAFGTAHRAHASTEGITHFLPSAAGLLMEKECLFFDQVLQSPQRPLAAVIGGAKVSSKIAVLESLLTRADAFVIGGAMAYTFLKTQGKSIGNSLLEEDFLPTAESFLKKARDRGIPVILPQDHVTAREFSEDAVPEVVHQVDVPPGRIAMDIGPKTVEEVGKLLGNAKTVLWNGPMGVFEFDAFSVGTLQVAKMVAACQGVTIVGGGDSVAAVNKFNLTDRIDHVSTGGGASLEYLEGKSLPGVAALKE